MSARTLIIVILISAAVGYFHVFSLIKDLLVNNYFEVTKTYSKKLLKNH